MGTGNYAFACGVMPHMWADNRGPIRLLGTKVNVGMWIGLWFKIQNNNGKVIMAVIATIKVGVIATITTTEVVIVTTVLLIIIIIKVSLRIIVWILTSSSNTSSTVILLVKSVWAPQACQDPNSSLATTKWDTYCNTLTSGCWHLQGSKLSDAQLFAVVTCLLDKGRVEYGLETLYMVVTASEVSLTSGFCSQYCGWHDHGTWNNKNVR
jgi:hypothetical protein